VSFWEYLTVSAASWASYPTGKFPLHETEACMRWCSLSSIICRMTERRTGREEPDCCLFHCPQTSQTYETKISWVESEVFCIFKSLRKDLHSYGSIDNSRMGVWTLLCLPVVQLVPSTENSSARGTVPLYYQPRVGTQLLEEHFFNDAFHSYLLSQLGT
jgi:hypothetical protein